MASEEWRQCVEWLVRCQILPNEHKATKVDASAFDLAQALRDGVLICHLLNQLCPGSVDPKDFSPRPQMSQVCTFLSLRELLPGSLCKIKNKVPWYRTISFNTVTTSFQHAF